jgi:hypothetical protein
MQTLQAILSAHRPGQRLRQPLIMLGLQMSPYCTATCVKLDCSANVLRPGNNSNITHKQSVQPSQGCFIYSFSHLRTHAALHICSPLKQQPFVPATSTAFSAALPSQPSNQPSI